jgi:hypothetical protein
VAKAAVRHGRTAAFLRFGCALSMGRRNSSNQTDEYPGTLEKKIGQV